MARCGNWRRSRGGAKLGGRASGGGGALLLRGEVAEAEDAWERACSREAGCAKYKDLDYVRRVRRWPPAMVGKLEKFLELKS